MNDLSTTTSRPLAPKPAPELEKQVTRLVCSIPANPSDPITIVASLTAALAAAIEKRIGELEAAIAHRDPRATDTLITILLSNFSANRAGCAEGEAEAFVSSYAWELEGVSPLAVEGAVRHFLSSGREWAPSGSQVCAEAKEIVATWRREVLRLRRVLEAEVRERIRPISRERRTEIEADVQAAAARAGLKAKLAELGVDPAELNKIPDAPPRADTFERAPCRRGRGPREGRVKS